MQKLVHHLLVQEMHQVLCMVIFTGYLERIVINKSLSKTEFWDMWTYVTTAVFTFKEGFVQYLTFQVSNIYQHINNLLNAEYPNLIYDAVKELCQ